MKCLRLRLRARGASMRAARQIQQTRRWYSFTVLFACVLTACGIGHTTAQTQQAQPINRVELAAFIKIGTVTDELWGADAYYRFDERFGAFGTLTVVDSVGMSGWMADVGIRFGWLHVWKVLQANLGVGVRVIDMTDGTKVRAITESRWGLRLGRMVPFFVTRFTWPYVSESAETVWGVAVALW